MNVSSRRRQRSGSGSLNAHEELRRLVSALIRSGGKPASVTGSDSLTCRWTRGKRAGSGSGSRLASSACRRAAADSQSGRRAGEDADGRESATRYASSARRQNTWPRRRSDAVFHNPTTENPPNAAAGASYDAEAARDPVRRIPSSDSSTRGLSRGLGFANHLSYVARAGYRCETRPLGPEHHIVLSSLPNYLPSLSLPSCLPPQAPPPSLRPRPRLPTSIPLPLTNATYSPPSHPPPPNHLPSLPATYTPPPPPPILASLLPSPPLPSTPTNHPVPPKPSLRVKGNPPFAIPFSLLFRITDSPCHPFSLPPPPLPLPSPPPLPLAPSLLLSHPLLLSSFFRFSTPAPLPPSPSPSSPPALPPSLPRRCPQPLPTLLLSPISLSSPLIFIF
ncbi:hypothetical protein C7M84_014392 [Penaeus vannamei]|uniref:Uncharacterized protein n=1 Tax=Penaeus vannamei TaxID=6689 RepID=A0A423STK7_PENVA|nr:hypothetical protein C7M84_014392 [Penaeus vannamei]